VAPVPGDSAATGAAKGVGGEAVEETALFFRTKWSTADNLLIWANGRFRLYGSAAVRNMRKFLGYNNESLDSPWGKDLIQHWMDRDLAKIDPATGEMIFKDIVENKWYPRAEIQIEHTMAAVTHANLVDKPWIPESFRRAIVYTFQHDPQNFVPISKVRNAKEGAAKVERYPR
jgi:hypothetical protein